MIKRIYERHLIGLLLLVFLFAVGFGLCAKADAPDGEFETAIMTFIDAIKVGQVGLIILAVVQLLKTRVVTMFLVWIAAKFGAQAVQSQDAMGTPAVAENADPTQGYVPVQLPKLPGAAMPVATVAVGALAGIAESIATGKPVAQAVFEGLLSSGVSMSLYDLVLKPIVKRFTS